MRLLIQLLISTLAIMVTQYVLPGVHVESYFTGIVVAIILGILNTLIKPIMVALTFPITIVTFGLFLIVINALVIQMTAWLVGGFTVEGFWWAVLFSIILSLITSFFNSVESDS